jgi:nitrate reductase delta subunit
MELTRGDRLRLLASMLVYPDEGLFDALPDAADFIGSGFPETERDALLGFIDYLASTPELKLREVYTRTFDLDPAASLNLTWHSLGEEVERGSALADIAGMYRSAGFEPAVEDLPDWLPMVLEFIAVVPAAEGGLASHLAQVGKILKQLREKGSPYLPVFEVLEKILFEERAGINSTPTALNEPDGL